MVARAELTMAKRRVKCLELLLGASFLLTSACAHVVDACPNGLVPDGDHCVDEENVERGGLAGADGAIEPFFDASAGEGERVLDATHTDDSLGTNPGVPPDLPDSGTRLDGTLDAPCCVDAEQSFDAFPQSSGVAETGVTPDTGWPPDSGEDDAASAGPCNDVDLSRWRAFQTSGRIAQTMATCATDPSCAVGVCDLMACVRRTAGLTACSTCVAEETHCALSACPSVCTSSDSSDACRACACAQGCIGATSACGMGSIDICADCNGSTCGNFSLSATLIVVIGDGSN